MSYLGTNSIGKIYLGGTQISKAYLGDQLVYQYGSGPTPPPVVTPVFYNYLYFDGTAYIQTTYVLPANCSIRVGLGGETNKTAQQVLGASGTNGGYIAVYYGGGTNSTNRQVVVNYDSSSYVKTKNLAWSYTSFAFFLTPNRMGWGNSTNTFTKGSLHPDGGLYFGVHSPQSTSAKFSGRMGQIRIYGSDASGVTTDAGFNNYTPVATFRPCTYNGVAGLWYEEGSTFFGNSAGSGTLTASDT